MALIDEGNALRGRANPGRPQDG